MSNLEGYFLNKYMAIDINNSDKKVKSKVYLINPFELNTPIIKIIKKNANVTILTLIKVFANFILSF